MRLRRRRSINVKKFLMATILLLSPSCIANGFYEGVASGTPKNVLSENKKIFIGVPLLLSLTGSSAKYNNEWYVTAAHNKPLLGGKEAYYHPVCDFAIFRNKSDKGKEPKLGYVFKNEDTYHVGYPVGMLISSHKGKYIGEVFNPGDKCIYSASDATTISGMSGGGVYNKYGELVGVNIGIMQGAIEWPNGKVEFSPSIFMSINTVKIFIEEVTGSKVMFKRRGKSLA
jgi:hypothetical protein